MCGVDELVFVRADTSHVVGYVNLFTWKVDIDDDQTNDSIASLEIPTEADRGIKR